MAFIVQAVRSYFSSGIHSSTIDIDRAAVLLLTVSIFAPFYFSLVVVSCIALMTMVNYRIRTEAFSAPYTKLIFVFLIISFFVAAIYNNYRGMAYSILIYAVVTCGLYLRSVMTRQLFHQAMDTACVASVWCVAIALIQKASAFAAAPNYRPVSVFTNANYYGMMIEFVVLIALYRIFTNPEHVSFYAIVIGLNFIGLYLTASYSSFAALLCAVLVMLAYKKKTKLTAVVLLGALMYVALCLSFPSMAPRGAEAIETTLAQRLSIWNASILGIKQHPVFGCGAMTYQMVCEQLGGYKTYHCHNLLLDILLNFGVAGFSAICIYIIMQVRSLLLRFRNNICSNMNILLIASLVAVLVHGLTDVTILWIQTGALFFLIYSSIGIGSSCLEKENIVLPNLLPGYSKEHALAVYIKN